jgi:predicted nucleic acid-binding protein
LSVYADSSFLLSTCTLDVHTAEASRRLSARPVIWITHFNRVEVANAISRFVHRGRMPAKAARAAWSNFQQDVTLGLWISKDIPENVWEVCIDLAWRHGQTLGVRTLDSLHVACAVELGAKKFWTFDERQARLAEAVGLDTTA